MTDRDGGAGFVTGLFFGGLLGFAAGILLAPKSGEETRALIVERGGEWRDKAEELAAAANERIASATEESRRVAAKMRGELNYDEMGDENR